VHKGGGEVRGGVDAQGCLADDSRFAYAGAPRGCDASRSWDLSARSDAPSREWTFEARGLPRSSDSGVVSERFLGVTVVGSASPPSCQARQGAASSLQRSAHSALQSSSRHPGSIALSCRTASRADANASSPIDSNSDVMSASPSPKRQAR
jgi:hypothetical protein